MENMKGMRAKRGHIVFITRITIPDAADSAP